MRTLSLSLTIFLLIALSACGGTSLSANRLNAGLDGSTQGVLEAQDGAQLAVPPIVETAAERAVWAQLEAPGGQGTPGTDYYPNRFLVTFEPNAKLPAGWVPASPAALAVATDPSDALVRDYHQFEPLAAAIAERYGLVLDAQVYRGTQLLAGFKVPDAIDPPTVLGKLRNEGAGLIAHVIYDPKRHHDYTPNDPDYTSGNAAGSDYSAQWGTHRVKATQAWDYTKGDSTITIAVVDTGVRFSHESLVGTVQDPAVAYPTQKVNFCPVGGIQDVTDNDGHGTYISGLVGAHQDDSKKITGLAPGCKIMPLKISDDGQAADTWMINAMNKADALGAQVINLSWGGDGQDPAFQTCLNNLKTKGRFLAISAGNNGDQGNALQYPGAYSDICVGATGDGSANPDARPSYSNFKSSVDIAAPGTWLKSTLRTSDTAYADNPNAWESGTSFSAPLVAAAAALIWSYSPSMTRDEVLDLLETTGDATTGFVTSADTGQPVHRINLEQAFLQIASVGVRAPKLTKMIYSGTVSLTATANSATSVSCSVNGNSLGSLTSAPYTWDIDTTFVTFGKVSVTFTATDGVDSDSETIEFIADNTTATYPLTEEFNAGDPRVFDGVDVKSYSNTFLSAIKAQPAGEWTADSVANAGAGSWTIGGSGGFPSGPGAFMGIGSSNYDNLELDCLVSRKVNLSGISNPTLVFQHHYNVENGTGLADRVRVLVTDDDGQTFTAAKLGGTANDAVWSGYQANYIEADVDLVAFTGKTVNVVLVFESNGSVIGENTTQSKGWWVDDLVLSRGYATAVPTIDSVVLSQVSMPSGLPTIGTSTVVGKALSLTDFDANITTPVDVTRVLYWLDFAPFGTLGLEDKSSSSTTGPDFPSNLTLPTNKKNQMAILHVQCFDAANNPGTTIDKTVWMFSLRGDTDASGLVDQADLDNYTGKIGLTPSNPGYSVFLDTDLDGVITEADASGVGYNWGKTN